MIDVKFEASPLEEALERLQPGDALSALTFLTLTQQDEEDEIEEALQLLEQRQVALDISDLPPAVGDGSLAVRLRQEQQLVRQGNLLTQLEANDPLRLYLEELAAIPVCGDVAAIAKQYLHSDEAAAQKLADLSLSRCVELALERTGYGVLLLDLIQEASLGLWQGILCYQGGDFEAHRDWWICQYLAKTIVLQARAGGIGQKLRSGMEDYRDVDQRLLVELGRNPTLEEIAEGMHVSVQEAQTYADMVSTARSRRQIDVQREEKEQEPDDEQAVEDTAYFQSRQRIMELLSALNEQETQVLTLRFGLEGGLPLTPEQTGEKLRLTAQEVVQIEANALSKLRNE